MRNMLQFHLKILKPNSFQCVFFPAVCIQFLNVLLLKKFETFENKRSSYVVYYFEESCCIWLKSHFKNDPDESEKNQIQRF